MIQRKQTLFLLIALLLLGVLIFSPIAIFIGEQGATALTWMSVEDVSQPDVVEVVKTLPALAGLMIVAVALNLIGIFMFKNRPLQMRMVGIACGVEVGLVGVLTYLSFGVAEAVGCEMYFNFRLLIPLAAAVMDFLALRRISDDEALIRSLDRLR